MSVVEIGYLTLDSHNEGLEVRSDLHGLTYCTVHPSTCIQHYQEGICCLPGKVVHKACEYCDAENKKAIEDMAAKQAEQERDNQKLVRSNYDIKQAVRAWCSDRTAAEAKYGYISNWNVSAVTDMKQLFKGETAFNDDISEWDTSKVTTMQSMFDGAIAYNQYLIAWDTSKVTTMKRMFFDARAFNQI